MNINLEYEIGKGKVAEYIAIMNSKCEAIREEIVAFKPLLRLFTAPEMSIMNTHITAIKNKLINIILLQSFSVILLLIFHYNGRAEGN